MPPVVAKNTVKLPDPDFDDSRELFVPVRCVRMTVSAKPMVEHVTTKLDHVAEPAALNMVIWPDGVLDVTPVVRLVSCVTDVPAPAP